MESREKFEAADADGGDSLDQKEVSKHICNYLKPLQFLASFNYFFIHLFPTSVHSLNNAH